MSRENPQDAATPAGRTVGGVQLTHADLLEGARTHFRAALRRPRVFVIAALVTAGAFAFGTWIISSQQPSAWVGLVAAIVALAYCCGLIALLYLVSVPRAVRRVWQQNKLLHETLEVSWGESGFRVRGANVSSDMPWSYYRGWRETPTTFQLYYSPVNYQIVPKRHLDATQQADLRKTLAEAGVAERSGPV